jgi:predicted transposase YbfD/YdcC
VKKDQKRRRAAIERQFAVKQPPVYEATHKGHGRVETRSLQVCEPPDSLKGSWVGVNQLLKITRTRWTKGKETTEIAYGITSLSKDEAPPAEIMKLWRDHWRIENQLHYVRDVVFHEDWSTLRKGNSAQIMAALQNLVIYLAAQVNQSVTDLRLERSRFYRKPLRLILEN